ncbi:MAG TPA: hypothetical protein VHX87_01375 [Galbitalea sp.]|jgi:hypothetical protein|nr:hypothetical protein [Galbitalea sp.]
MPSLTPRTMHLKSTALSISAIGSVLGGVSNSIVVGHTAENLITADAWQIGSVTARRRLSGAT